MANWKCRICGKPISQKADPDTYVVINRFHIHKECYTGIEQDKDNFFRYCQELFGDGFDFVKLNRMAEGYRRAYNYTWSGMHGSLVYFYEIKHHSVKDANNNIGIIPYIYKDAKDYFDKLEQVKENNSKQKEYKAQQKVVTIPIPSQTTRQPRLFSMEDE